MNLTIIIVFLPIIGAFLLPIIGKFSKLIRNWLAFIFIAVSFICSAMLIQPAITGNSVVFSKTLGFGINLVFVPDALAVFMACASSLIGAIIVLYSIGYIKHYEFQNEYYCMVVLFLGSMMGLIFSGNLILLYIFWEITAIASWRLIGFFREKKFVVKADKAFLVTVFGALVMLLGFIMIYQQTGSFDIAVIKQKLNGTPLNSIIVVLILFGILSKSATLPFHTWLPDAGVAPSPVTALLHAAVLVKIGVYVYARLFVASFDIEPIWNYIVPLIAGISTIISAGAALVEKDIKRIIAYSTISQIGYIFLGLSAGGDVALVGGLLYILMHGMAKAGLFLCAGIIEHSTHTKDITKMGGLIKQMPVTAVSFLLCAFSVMGIPPFGGFFSKYLVFAGGIKSEQYFTLLIFLFGAFFTIIYLLRVFNMVFLGEIKIEGKKEGFSVMVFSVASLAFLSLIGGLFIYFPSRFAEIAVSQMLGLIK